MAVVEGSRYASSNVIQDEDTNALYTELRDRLIYDDVDEVVLHKVVEGDTLHNLARRYYGATDSATGLWWVIADFQPEPLQDPTVTLETGSVLFIPPLSIVEDEIRGSPVDAFEGL